MEATNGLRQCDEPERATHLVAEARRLGYTPECDVRFVEASIAWGADNFARVVDRLAKQTTEELDPAFRFDWDFFLASGLGMQGDASQANRLVELAESRVDDPTQAAFALTEASRVMGATRTDDDALRGRLELLARVRDLSGDEEPPYTYWGEAFDALAESGDPQTMADLTDDMLAHGYASDFFVLVTRATALQQIGSVEPALESARRALARVPGEDSADEGVARLVTTAANIERISLLQLGRFDEARATVADLDAADPVRVDLESAALLAEGKPAEALAVVERIRDLGLPGPRPPRREAPM